MIPLDPKRYAASRALREIKWDRFVHPPEPDRPVLSSIFVGGHRRCPVYVAKGWTFPAGVLEKLQLVLEHDLQASVFEERILPWVRLSFFWTVFSQPNP